jgi:hypothetical protein
LYAKNIGRPLKGFGQEARSGLHWLWGAGQTGNKKTPRKLSQAFQWEVMMEALTDVVITESSGQSPAHLGRKSTGHCEGWPVELQRTEDSVPFSRGVEDTEEKSSD